MPLIETDATQGLHPNPSPSIHHSFSSEVSEIERILQAGSGLEQCQPICESPGAVAGDLCLCGVCVDSSDCGENCTDNCQYDPAAQAKQPPYSLVIEPIMYGEDSIEVEYREGGQDDCSNTFNKTDGHFVIQKYGNCTGKKDGLQPEIIINPDSDCPIQLHTSCSYFLYLGQVYDAADTPGTNCNENVTFQLVGYCIKVRQI